MHQSEIFHLEFRGKLPLTLVYQFFVTCKKQVIYIQNKYQDMIMNNFKVQVRISCTFGKPQTMDKSIYLGMPDSRSLFQPIQGFLQFTYMGLLPMSNKSFKLLNIKFFLNLTIDDPGGSSQKRIEFKVLKKEIHAQKMKQLVSSFPAMLVS